MLNRRDSPNLDLLRSIAVLAVLADHIAATFGIAQNHGQLFWALGRWGVLLFFIHTSLVLMMAMERTWSKDARPFLSFYIRRAFRIYPLSIFAVALTVSFHIPKTSWGSGFEFLGLRTILSNLLLCQNLANTPSVSGPLWSLPYEVQMYLLLPALFVLLRGRAPVRRLLAIWGAAVGIGLLQAWFADLNVFGASRLGIAEYAPCFLTGVTAYYLVLRRPIVRLPFIAWTATLAVMTTVYLHWNASEGYVGYVEWICCLPVGILITCCAESGYGLLNRVTHDVAKYSYGLYLAQVPVLWLAFAKCHDLPRLAQCSLCLCLIVLVPVAAYHLIESPFIRLGTSVARRASKKWASALPAEEAAIR
jgi:peptidoglycan/LPS O-acetylase OafA/YrhL